MSNSNLVTESGVVIVHFVVPAVTDEQLAATHAGWRPPEVRYLRPKGYGSRGAVPGGHGCWEKRRYSLTEKGWAHGAAR